MIDTFYNGNNGVSSVPPLSVGVWASDNGGRIGWIDNFLKMEATWVERGTDVLELEVPLNELSRTLIPCDGAALLLAEYNGKQILAAPLVTQSGASQNYPAPTVTITAAGGWRIFNGAIAGPYPDSEVFDVDESGRYIYTGTLKQALQNICASIGYPVEFWDSGWDAPVHVEGAWDNTGDFLLDAVHGTDHMIKFHPVMPGIPTSITGNDRLATFERDRPTYIVHIAPQRNNAGFQYVDETTGRMFDRPPGIDAADATAWELRTSAATDTTIVVDVKTSLEGGGESISRHSSYTKAGTSPWSKSVRRVLIDDKADPSAAMEKALAEGGIAQSLTAEMGPGWNKTFGVSNAAIGGMVDIGDWLDIFLPGDFWAPHMLTEVTVEQTPTSCVVKPILTLPDNWYGDNTNL